MFRSIRWSLQLWHALLLLAVVCTFGGVLYFRLEHTRFKTIDTELQASAEVMAAKMRPGPPRRGRPRPSTNPSEPFGHHHEPDRSGSDRPGPPPDRGGGDWFGPDRGGPDRGADRAGGPGSRPSMPLGEADLLRLDEVEKQTDIHESVLRQFQREGPDAPYFAIWRSNGELLRTSRADLPIPPPPGRAHFTDPPPQFRQRGQVREVIVPGPFAMQVLVGRSIAKEQAELMQLLWLLGLTGAGVTIIGLVGGWLLTGKAIRPIRTMTAAAQEISASNLSRRIDATETKNELGALAGVLNAMFARLQTAFEQQVRFTADASHELRTPLSVIYSHAELALSRERSAPEYRDALEACFRASKRMKVLVESLLVLARADAGKLEIKHEPLDLAQVAGDCVELVRPLADQKNVEIETSLSPACISGDEFRMAQVITNLVTNAIYYNRDGGRVTVEVGVWAQEVVLKVADTGMGIAPEDQAHLFERFFRVDKARSRAQGGSGLGLAIARSIVEAHGGTVSFTSRADEGTTFEVRLPCAQQGVPVLTPSPI